MDDAFQNQPKTTRSMMLSRTLLFAACQDAKVLYSQKVMEVESDTEDGQLVSTRAMCIQLWLVLWCKGLEQRLNVFVT